MINYAIIFSCGCTWLAQFVNPFQGIGRAVWFAHFPGCRFAYPGLALSFPFRELLHPPPMIGESNPVGVAQFVARGQRSATPGNKPSSNEQP